MVFYYFIFKQKSQKQNRDKTYFCPGRHDFLKFMTPRFSFCKSHDCGPVVLLGTI